MNQPDDQNDSGLRVSGYGPRVRQTLIVGIILALIVAAIAAAAMWSNSLEPEVGVQPTPRPTPAPEPTATVAPLDTATLEPTEPAEVKVADTATPAPTEVPATDTPTPTTQISIDNPIPTAIPPTVAATETPGVEVAPTAEPTVTPTVEATATQALPTEEPTVVPTDTPLPEPTATPIITPTPLPTATPTITPTPALKVPTKLEIYARGELIDQGIDQGDIKVLNVEEHMWRDLTLGCGAIEGDNPARQIKGWILTLGNDETAYTFHVANKEQGDPDEHLKDEVIRDCTGVENTEQLAVNLVHDLRLHEARRVVLYRGPASGEQAAIQDIRDGERIQVLLDALNTNTPIGNTAICETAYRLDFYTLRGVQTIRFFCGKDWYRGAGEQDVWAGTQGALTQGLLDAVAPYLAAEPLPPLPTWTPEE